MKYHIYLFELEIALDRHINCSSRLLDQRNHCWKGEDKDRDAVNERIKVEYYSTRSHNQHLAVARSCGILSILPDYDGDEC